MSKYEQFLQRNRETAQYMYQGKPCFICFEWSGFHVSIRFGTPRAWQGEVTVDRRELVAA